VRIEQCQQRFGGGDGGRDGGLAAPPVGRSEQLHEGLRARQVQRGLLPVHPALGVEARAQVLRIEPAAAVLRAQVAHESRSIPRA
jgi:hypothetical protein